ncbi:serine/threonine-protein kinase TBK1-like [Haliotis rubra]|uniref:serine/threonine-protein kinase TBK1-like n=1 Tax=Haliotis rubra TaxID=36100 RepID=UPI001EE5B8B9|nr:serine/threonine-protein kinase TBK1-like [Haliotis rubra]
MTSSSSSPSSSSSALRGSMNFVWDLNRPLGQGATSMVYSGRNKRNGDAVAVKVFNASSYQRPAQVQFREYEVMKKLNHENIVKLLAVEEEQTAYQKVLVMELCPHGSLFTLLEEPDNGFGLSEEEFLLVLKHVSLGMKHLHDLDVVHRDIKPGNILRHIGEDGRSIYKLTDFGAARELHDEERFTSLYGTEEYLHPDMYERAVLRRGTGQKFFGTVDLWSLGVTIYHTATGSLPFRPFGGGRNRETMHQITTKKEYGVISGVQRCEGGPIDWSRELPQTSRLSNGLKLFITPVLAALLERNPERTMPFEKFFHESATITSKLSTDIFCPALCSSIRVFLDRTDGYSKLQERIAEQTDIPASDQLILYDGQELTSLVEHMTPVHTYPLDISPTHPLIVYNKSDDHLCYCKPAKGKYLLSGYRDDTKMIQILVPSPTYRARATWTSTPAWPRNAALCCVQNPAVETLLSRSCHMHVAVRQYRQTLYNRISSVTNIVDNLIPFCRATQQWHENFLRLQNQQLRVLQLLLNTSVGGSNIQTLMTQVQETLRTSQAKCQSGALKVQQMLDQAKKGLDSVMEMHQKVKSWKQDKTFKEERWFERIQVVSGKTKAIMYKFKEDKAKRVLNYNEEQIHHFERCSLNELCSKAKSIFETVDERVKLQAGAYKQWYSCACQCWRQCQVLGVKLKELFDQQSKFLESLNSCCMKYQQIVEDRLKCIEQDSGVSDLSLAEYDNVVKMDDLTVEVNKETSARKGMSGDLLDMIKTSRSSLEEVMLLVHENTSLLHSFNGLGLEVDAPWQQPDVT